MQRFTDLKVWQRAHTLVLEIYRVSDTFPQAERFGLTAQLRRAAASVPTNVAEGAKRQHNTDYARFLNIAEGSIAETEYLLLLARDLNYLPKEKAAPMMAEAEEVSRMLSVLRERVQAGS